MASAAPRIRAAGDILIGQLLGIAQQPSQFNGRGPHRVLTDIAHHIEEEPVVRAPDVLRQKYAVGAAVRLLDPCAAAAVRIRSACSAASPWSASTVLGGLLCSAVRVAGAAQPSIANATKIASLGILRLLPGQFRICSACGVW